MPLFHTAPTDQTNNNSTVATITTVASVITSVVILAANTSRKGAIVNNKSTSRLYLAMGATATTSSLLTVPLDPDDYWEIPFNYTGIISGIWVTANGNAVITELT